MLVMTGMAACLLRCSRDASDAAQAPAGKIFSAARESASCACARDLRARPRAARRANSGAGAAARRSGSQVVLARPARRSTPNSGSRLPPRSQWRARLGRASATPWPLTAASSVSPRSTSFGPLRRARASPGRRRANQGAQGSIGVRSSGAWRRSAGARSGGSRASSAGAAIGSTRSCISSRPPARPGRRGAPRRRRRRCRRRGRGSTAPPPARRSGCAAVKRSRRGTRICRAKVGGALTRSRCTRCAARRCSGIAASRPSAARTCARYSLPGWR